MVERSVLTFTSLFLILFGAVTSTLHVELIVDPPVVIKGQPVAFICLRNIEDEEVYTVKWSRGTHEFFRYTPGDTHPLKQFGIRGISVKMDASNGTQVMLRFFDHELSGDFSCEVTSESRFTTKNDTKFIEVISMPAFDPVLQTDKERYQAGDVLTANCSSAPAKPTPNLTIYINDEQQRSISTTWHSSYSEARVNVKLKLTAAHFPSGRLRLKCLASIYNVYKRVSKLDFFTPDTSPRPERITHNSGASSCLLNWFLIFILLFLPLVLCQDYDDLADSAPSDGIQYYDDESEMNAIISAIGG